MKEIVDISNKLIIKIIDSNLDSIEKDFMIDMLDKIKTYSNPGPPVTILDWYKQGAKDEVTGNSSMPNTDLEIKAYILGAKRYTPKSVDGLLILMGDEDKLRFEELDPGQQFIGIPIPGDNSGHGGYKTTHFVFTKVSNNEARKVANNEKSLFPPYTEVIAIK